MLFEPRADIEKRQQAARKWLEAYAEHCRNAEDNFPVPNEQ